MRPNTLALMDAVPTPAYIAVSAVALIVAVVFAIQVVRAKRRSAALGRRLAAAEQLTRELDATVSEQGSRLRIIRELHDIAVARVSTMVEQAEAARYAGTEDPTAVARAAGAIAETGTQTLADIRRVMLLVRDAGPQEESPSGRAALQDLVGLNRDAGLVVRFEQTGTPYPLGAGAELAVYRILQEALDNSLRHGGPGTEVRIVESWTPTGLALRIEDNGFRNAVLARQLPPDEEASALTYTPADDLDALTREFLGPGVAEMRTRAELFGGTLQATEVPGVGFSLSVSFPAIRHHNAVHGVDLSR